jgi:hypothetical protein
MRGERAVAPLRFRAGVGTRRRLDVGLAPPRRAFGIVRQTFGVVDVLIPGDPLTNAEAARLRVMLLAQAAFILVTAAVATCVGVLLTLLFPEQTARFAAWAIGLMKFSTVLDKAFSDGGTAGLGPDRCGRVPSFAIAASSASTSSTNTSTSANASHGPGDVFAGRTAVPILCGLDAVDDRLRDGLSSFRAPRSTKPPVAFTSITVGMSSLQTAS